MASSLGEIKLNIDLPQWSTIMSPLTGYSVRFDMGGSTNMPISTTPESVLADLVRQIGKDTDLSGVKNALDCVEAEKKSKIRKALEGVADMTLLEKPATKRFVLVYWLNNASHTADGVAYEGAEDAEDEDDEDHETTVHLQPTGDYRIPVEQRSMAALRKRLDDQKILYVIKYID